VGATIDWTKVPSVEIDSRATDKYRLHHGDIVIARTGASTGASAYINEPPLAVFASYLVRLKTIPEFDSRFVSYYLRSDAFWSFIRGVLGDKSAQPNASARTMTQAPFRAPASNKEQRAIAHILGTLDDKIELNRRMSETLGAMAQALFKSWFVDFDPVKAKAAGRDTGLPISIAELFPDSFDHSDQGKIPTGWPRVPFTNTVEIFGGGTPKTNIVEYWNGGIPWFSIADAPADFEMWVIDTEKTISPAGLENSSTTLLLERTTIISARGTVGKIAMAGTPMAINQSCYGLRGKLGTLGTFAYFATQQLLVLLRQRAHGSVFSTITRDTLASVSVVEPPRLLVQAYEDLAEPMAQRIRAGMIESRVLTHVRDALLPMLLTGKIRVQGAATAVAGALQ